MDWPEAEVEAAAREIALYPRIKPGTIEEQKKKIVKRISRKFRKLKLRFIGGAGDDKQNRMAEGWGLLQSSGDDKGDDIFEASLEWQSRRRFGRKQVIYVRTGSSHPAETLRRQAEAAAIAFCNLSLRDLERVFGIPRSTLQRIQKAEGEWRGSPVYRGVSHKLFCKTSGEPALSFTVGASKPQWVRKAKPKPGLNELPIPRGAKKFRHLVFGEGRLIRGRVIGGDELVFDCEFKGGRRTVLANSIPEFRDAVRIGGVDAVVAVFGRRRKEGYQRLAEIFGCEVLGIHAVGDDIVIDLRLNGERRSISLASFRPYQCLVDGLTSAAQDGWDDNAIAERFEQVADLPFSRALQLVAWERGLFDSTGLPKNEHALHIIAAGRRRHWHARREYLKNQRKYAAA